MNDSNISQENIPKINFPKKKCTECKLLSSTVTGIDDEVNGFMCEKCYCKQQEKTIKKQGRLEFIQNKLPLISMTVTSALTALGILVIVFYK